MTRAIVVTTGGGDRAVGVLAGRNEGVVNRRHLAAAGLDARAVRRRVHQGLLHPQNASVLAVGHPHLSTDAVLLAAIWAYDEIRATVGFRSASARWRLLSAERGPVDVIAPVGSRRPGTRLHRVPLFPGDVRKLDGVRVTSPGRTLADLATIERPAVLEHAVHEAQVRRLLTAGEIERARRRSLRRRGGAFLRALLEEIEPGVRLRSELERQVHVLIRGSDFPKPDYNLLVEVPGLRCEADVAWLAHGLIIEVDGSPHETPTARRRDARRDAVLGVNGIRVERVRPEHLDDPARLLARLDPRIDRLAPPSGMNSYPVAARRRPGLEDLSLSD